MNMPKTELSIIIVSMNTADLLKQCLNSIFPLLHEVSSEVLVVDNNSSDGSVEMCEKSFPYVKLIKNSKNYGYGHANNQGISASTGDLILLLNSDSIVTPGNIEKLINVINKDSSIGVVGCRLISPDGRYQSCCANFSNLNSIIVERLLLYKISKKRILYRNYYWRTNY